MGGRRCPLQVYWVLSADKIGVFSELNVLLCVLLLPAFSSVRY